ncbi:MAG TPA: transglutaminase-like domain-containing protein [Gemmatimonadales bacterium]|nr:transglutaminase-like domain-containing protein [Gemmatimonadales bacterium]
MVREYGPEAEGGTASPSTVQLPPTSTFYAMRAGPDQVGLYSITTDTLPDGLRITSRTDVDVPLPLVPRRLMTTTEALYDRQLRLLEFTTTASGEAGQVTVNATATSTTLLSVVISGRGITASDTVEVRIPEGVLLVDAVPLALAARGGLASRAVTRLSVLDPLDLRVTSLELRVGAESTLAVADSAVVDPATGAWVPAGVNPTRAWRVRWMEHGLPVSAWIDRQGAVVERTTPLGLTLERGPFEIVNTGYVRRRPRNVQAIPLEVAVASEAAPGSTRVLLGGVDLRDAAPMLTTPWQAVVPGGIATRSARATQARAGTPVPDSIPASDRAMPASGRVAVEARRIAAADTNDPVTAVRRLSTWISAAIVPGSPAFGGAQQALLRRRGDSSDRAELLVQMARALGIPARPVAGLLTDGGRLRYRAWAEVWLGAWVPVDPTLGEFAEAGHIRLLTHATARPAAIVSLIGAVRPTLDTLTTVP